MPELEEIIRRIVREELRLSTLIAKAATPELMRLKAGYTTIELADKAGVSQMTVSRIENGQVRHLRPHTLQKLAKVLGDDYLAAAEAIRISKGEK